MFLFNKLFCFFNSFLQSGDGILSFLLKNVTDSDVIIKMPSFFGIHLFDVTKYVVTIWGICLFVIVLVFIAFRSINNNKSWVAGRFRALIEIFVEFVKKEMVIPHFHSNVVRWTAFFSSLFFYIMICNLFGLIPGISSLTANLGVTLALASIIFVISLVRGIIIHGFFGYWKSIIPSGVPVFLKPILFVIELVGLVTKPFSLMVRLFANMLSGSIIVLILMFLVSELSGTWTQIGVAPLILFGSLAITLLKIFVSVLQAYIFTLLSIICVSASSEKH